MLFFSSISINEQKKISRFFKVFFYASIGTIRWNKFLLEKKRRLWFVFIIFGHWAKILRLLAKKFQQCCQISRVKGQRNTLMKANFFEKHWFFSKIQRNVFRCCQKNLLRVHRKNLMKKFLLLTLPFHKSSSDFQRTFFDCCWKVETIFYVSAGNFVEKHFFRKRYLFHHFRTFIKKIRQLCQTLSFGKINFILHGHGVTIFWPLFLSNFCRGCRKSILRVKRIALMKIIFFLEILYIFFFNIFIKSWALSFQPFIGKSPENWQNFSLRVHRNFSTERKLSKLKAFSSVLELQRKFFLENCQKLVGDVLRVRREKFDEKHWRQFFPTIFWTSR